MSYFDHVRCHSCRATIDPESLGGPDRGLVCPRCGVALNLQDLFGLADAFAEEEEGPVSLDDLVSGRPAPRAAPPAPTSGPPARVERKDEGPASGALAAMRSLKRR